MYLRRGRFLITMSKNGASMGNFFVARYFTFYTTQCLENCHFPVLLFTFNIWKQPCENIPPTKSIAFNMKLSNVLYITSLFFWKLIINAECQHDFSKKLYSINDISRRQIFLYNSSLIRKKMFSFIFFVTYNLTTFITKIKSFGSYYCYEVVD